ncbi:hypothetical protein SAMN04487988_11037 [Algoriphagus hitonicola]|uniref:Uncharacterized protein n=2 Tax=Algoriphagus hitonicola TaxID=435880 RepID=A0A1I2VN48_9BACT|nr:hypothetical protein SAMN04487988_11037 [Algoriphagus hitonicola]
MYIGMGWWGVFNIKVTITFLIILLLEYVKMEKIFKNIISFGAYNRVVNANSDYQRNLEKLKVEFSFHEKRREETNKEIRKLINLKKRSVKKIRKIKKITSLLTIKQRTIVQNYLSDKGINLTKIEIDISINEAAFNLGKGSFLGISTGTTLASGTWALAGYFGTASTGTAISTLSGAAATNATLAWFGGGSLATGGAGIAGGTMVLGGIVILPIIGVSALVQHRNANKKIKMIREENLKITNHLSEIKKNLLSFELIDKRIEEISISINKGLEVFENSFEQTYREIFRFGILSKIIKWFKFKLFKNPYSQDELKKIALLGEQTRYILKIIDTKLLENE